MESEVYNKGGAQEATSKTATRRKLSNSSGDELIEKYCQISKKGKNIETMTNKKKGKKIITDGNNSKLLNSNTEISSNSDMELEHHLELNNIHEIIGTQPKIIEQVSQSHHQTKMYPTQTNNTQYNKMSTQTNTQRKTPVINTYTEKDKGPFYVMMERENINEISISKFLMSVNLNSGIKEIRKLNQNKIRVEVRAKSLANDIIKNVPLRKLQLINSYIPNQFVKTVGVVRGIPVDLTNEEIYEYMESDVHIDSFERLNYWDKKDQVTKPGTTIKINFRSTSLPHEIKIFYVVKKVFHYIPKPVVCRNCLIYGHTANVCKSKNISLCNNCAEKTHHFKDESCNKSCIHCKLMCITKCKYCNENHKTISGQCPEMEKQSKIKEIIVKEKLSYGEAKNILENKNNDTTTYAKVTHMMNFNKQLLERLRTTETLLKNIMDIGQGHNASTSTETTETRVFNIVKYITEHFKTFKINRDNINPDIEEISNHG